jgi:hypothetical protein
MKSYCGFTSVGVGALTMLLSLAAHPAPPAEKTPKKPADAKQTLSAQETAVPTSVFVVPADPKEGKDPFFPASMRIFASQQPVVPKGQKAPVIEIPLTLTGIIPLKLAMVNGRTFEPGEEGEVVANGVRKKIRCLKVKTESAIVELLPEGERRELKLRFGAN